MNWNNFVQILLVQIFYEPHIFQMLFFVQIFLQIYLLAYEASMFQNLWIHNGGFLIYCKY